MLKKVHVISSAGAWLIVALFLGSCAPGVSFVTGVKRKSLNYEQVKIYPAPPPRYDVVGYVEGLQGRDLFMTQEKQELKALQSMRKRAAQMGANGAVLTSIEYRTDYNSDPVTYDGLCYCTGWAVYVPEGEPDSKGGGVKSGKRASDKGYKIYIEPPVGCEILGQVSSRREYWFLPNSTVIGMGLDDLKLQVLEMGGNGLYVLDVRKEEEVKHADILESVLLNVGLGEASVRYFYVFSGQAIRVSNDDVP